MDARLRGVVAGILGGCCGDGAPLATSLSCQWRARCPITPAPCWTTAGSAPRGWFACLRVEIGEIGEIGEVVAVAYNSRSDAKALIPFRTSSPDGPRKA